MRHVIHIWLVCVSAIAIIQALPFELSESASYKNLENGLILLRFHFNASYQSESDCEPGFCLFRYGDTPRAYLDTLLELEVVWKQVACNHSTILTVHSIAAQPLPVRRG